MIRLRRSIAQHGVALIIVLWVMVVVVLLATSFTRSVRGEAKLTHRTNERVRAGVGAEAGLRRIMVALSAAGDVRANDEQLSVSPRAVNRYQLTFDGIALSVWVIPEVAFIDLNVSPEPLIRGMVISAAETVGGRSEQQINAIVDSILDWRDADSKRREFGAEWSDYRAVGRQGPQDQPFMSIDELAQVANVDRELFLAMRPMLTVFSWLPQIDPMAASERVLRALPEIDEETVNQVLALRADATSAGEIESTLSQWRRYLARRSNATYTIVVRAETQTSVVAVRRAVVKLARRATRPMAILAWHHDDGDRIADTPVSRDDQLPGALVPRS